MAIRGLENSSLGEPRTSWPRRPYPFSWLIDCGRVPQSKRRSNAMLRCSSTSATNLSSGGPRGCSMSTDAMLKWTASAGHSTLVASGSWIAVHANRLEQAIEQVAQRHVPALNIDLGRLEELDVFGAWLLQKLVRSARARGQVAEMTGVPDR